MGINSKTKTDPKTNKSTKKVFSAKKRKTYLRMLRSIVCAVALIIVVLIVLQLLGVNVSSILAGVGVASIIIGFALQDALKDLFRGLVIVADDYYDIGDIIKFGDNLGQVISINLRTTKIQDINTMNIVSIANRDIDKVEVSTGYIYLPVPFPLRVKPAAADAIMREIVKGISKLEKTTSVISQGTSNITNSSLNYQLQITCEPANQLQARRDCVGVIVDTFAAHKIPFPYNQVDLHTKK